MRKPISSKKVNKREGTKKERPIKSANPSHREDFNSLLSDAVLGKGKK